MIRPPATLGSSPALLAGGWPIVTRWAHLVGQTQDPQAKIAASVTQMELAQLLEKNQATAHFVHELRGHPLSKLPAFFNQLDEKPAAHIIDQLLPSDLKATLERQVDALLTGVAVVINIDQAGKHPSGHATSIQTVQDSDFLTGLMDAEKSENWQAAVFGKLDTHQRNTVIENFEQLPPDLRRALFYSSREADADAMRDVLYHLGVYPLRIAQSTTVNFDRARYAAYLVKDAYNGVFGQVFDGDMEAITAQLQETGSAVIDLIARLFQNDIVRLLIASRINVPGIPSEAEILKAAY